VSPQDKTRFDALHALSEQWWRDWDHKSQGEWRLSFGIWAALLASAAAVTKSLVPIPLVLAIVAGATVVTVHVMFLMWIHGTLRENRAHMRVCQKEMAKLAGLELKDEGWRPVFRKVSFLVQGVITLLLALVLVLMSVGRPSQAPAPAKPPTYSLLRNL
jgi:hypothetical protein